MELYSLSIISKLILLSPIWWILGFKFFIIHLVAVYLFIKLIITSKKENIKIKIHLTHKVLFIYICVYLTSILINTYQNDFSRTFASLYNWSFWFMGLLYMVTIYNDKTINFNEVKKLACSIKNIAIFHVLIFILGSIYWQKGELILAIPTLMQKILPNSIVVGLLDLSTTMHIYRSDWIFSTKMMRFSGMFNYPAALGLGMIFILLMTYYYFNVNNERIKFKQAILLICIGLMFLMGLSRITWIGITIGLFLSFGIFKYCRNRNENLKNILKIIAILIICIVFIIKVPIFKEIYNSRENSNNVRNLVYSKAIEYGMENPLLGIGVKIDNPNILVPVGSHSTYIGSFMKTGFIGISMLILFLMLLVLTWVKYKPKKIKDKKLYLLWQCCGVFLISSLIWMLTEDIDAPQIVALFFFINNGILTRLYKLDTYK
ncbi:O-antigen ligase family protein [Paraclostridium bifermentans]|uniref:O-antigen ligase family protein n=1 Tax=Paraclostridium bifermentans TaxID=1490 RepID=UPI001F471309|nr:O-antigen ligase family protein [Paraclostridium bifermentans]MCE9675723.1 O-antigen ligase family protein [Paraclostridium bifermentans]MCR1876255.1 O-antigen ligase family protein [Paraclostridium bifermentans]